jgi:hypothetical protein
MSSLNTITLNSIAYDVVNPQGTRVVRAQLSGLASGVLRKELTMAHEKGKGDKASRHLVSIDTLKVDSVDGKARLFRCYNVMLSYEDPDQYAATCYGGAAGDMNSMDDLFNPSTYALVAAFQQGSLG